MLRSRSGLTQAQLARLLGFNSPRMVRNWEGEFYLPTSDRLQRLVEIYLNRRVFVVDKEREEAELLWNTVKNWFETHKNKFETYPVFDERWFAASLENINRQPTFSTPKFDETIRLPLKTRTIDASSTGSKNHNLPLSLSSFVGREQDVNRLLQLIMVERPVRRLITLTGVGGVGKTRLALEVADDLARRNYYPDGVWLVELATISDPTLVAQTMVVALGLEEKVGAIKEKAQLENLLVTHLHDKQLLLLVDNCEHLIRECSYLLEILLKNCPGLRALITSREIVNLTSETQYLVTGLSLPTDSTVTSGQPSVLSEAIQQSEATQLFIERAARRQTGFLQLVQNNEQTARAVVQICQHLDGLPLAIELAAARVSILSPVQILENLKDRFHLLTGGERTAKLRQQTLEAAMEWSYNLLSPVEQNIFQRLAVFAAGWTLEAAEQVCLNSNIAEGEVMNLVDQLANKSLVVVEVGGNYKNSTNKEWVAMLEPAQYRHCYLDTIREYALKQLQANQSQAELEVLHEQHARYYLQLVTQAETFFRTGQQKLWLKRLNLELDNLRAALEWCKRSDPSNQPRIELGLRMGGTLWRYWNATGYYQEGLEHLRVLQQQAQLAGLTDSPGYLMMQNARAFLHRCLGDYTKGQELAQQALELAEILSDPKQTALALYILGSIATRQGDYIGANLKYNQSLSLYRQLDDKRGVASVLYSLSTAAFTQADYELAARNGLECLQLYEELEDAEGLGQAYIILGNLEYAKSNYLAARSYYLQSLETLRKTGQKRLLAYTLNNLGIIAALLEEYESVFHYFNECVILAREIGDKQSELYGLINLVELSLLQENFTSARANVEKSMLLARQMGSKNFLADSLELSGWLELKINKYSKAQPLFVEALHLRAELGNREDCNKLFCGFIKLTWQANQLEQAITLAGFVTTSLAESAQPLKRYEQEIFDEVITPGVIKPGQPDFEEAYNSGKQMSLEQIISYVA